MPNPYTELSALVGPDHVRPDPGPQYAVDGMPAGWLVAPADAAQIAEVLKAAGRHGWKVFVRGAGTKIDIGNVPERVDVVLSTERLNRIRWYTPRDQTIGVDGGLRLADLQAALAAEGQRLPINPPFGDRCTLGGVVAADSSGCLRLGAGTIRDYLIGIEYVTGDGVVAKAGGRVVKNVAGYNFMQLLTGSLGQLGVITGVNLKVRPAPRGMGMVTATVGRRAEEAVAAVMASDVRPAFVELIVGPRPSQSGRELDDAGLHVGFLEDTAAAADWQCSRTASLLAQRFGAKPQIAAREGFAAAMPELEDNYRRDAVLKAGCRSSQVAAFAERAVSLLAECSPPLRWTVQASVANGVFFAGPVNDAGEEMPHWDEVLRPEPTAAALSQLRAELSAAGGYLVLQHAPAALKKAFSPWGPPRADWAMMARIKNAFDPEGVLNPGRMI